MADDSFSSPSGGDYGFMGPGLAQYAQQLAQQYGLTYDPTLPPINGPAPPAMPGSPWQQPQLAGQAPGSMLAPGSMIPGMAAPPLPSPINVGALPATPQQLAPQAALTAPAGKLPQQQQQRPQDDQYWQQLLQQYMQPVQPLQFSPLSPFANRGNFNMANAFQKIPLPSGFTGYQP